MDSKVFVFTGPESSGKTTFARASAARFGGGLVDEYAREYLTVTDGVYRYNELKIIGLYQIAKELIESTKNKYIWCDTDILTILIWSLDKFKKVNRYIQKTWDQQDFEERHYFLCYPDVPWQYDSLRENPLDRMRLYEIYKRFLEDKQVSFTVLKGSFEEKLDLIQQAFIQDYPDFKL